MKISHLFSWKRLFANLLIITLGWIQPLSALPSSWSVQPPIVSSTTDTISSLVLATSRDTGDAVAAWIINNTDVQVATYSSSSNTWTLQPTYTGFTTPTVVVAIEPSGYDAMVMWTDDSSIDLYYATQTGGWTSTPIYLLRGNLICQGLSMNNGGMAAACMTLGGIVDFLNFDGSTWTLTGGGLGTQSQILMEDPTNPTNNHAMVLWIDGSNVVSRYFNGIDWSSQQTVATDTIDGIGLTQTAFAFSHAPPKFTAFWSVLAGGTDPGVHGQYYDVSSDSWGLQFNPSTDIDDNFLQTASDPSPASLVTWYHTSSKNFSAQVGTPGGIFIPPTPATITWGKDYGSSALAVFGSTSPSDITEALIAATDGTSNIEVNSFESNGDLWPSWVTVYTVPSNNAVRNLAISLDSHDNGLLLWIEETSDAHYMLQWATSGEEQPIDPPHNPQGQQIANRYLKQLDLVNEIQWTRSETEDVIGYHLYRQGSGVIATLLSTGATNYVYRDHNQREGVSSTYWITAYNNTTESAPTNHITIP